MKEQSKSNVGNITMLLKLPSGFKISIPPVFFWERRHARLSIRSRSVFHPDHITSRLCLELLDRHLSSLPCRSLLDIGCGSGILALAASRMGVPLVAGVDIDPRAIELSRENAVKNQLADRAHWVLGSTAALRGPFDCLVANLPYGVIDAVADDFPRLLDPEGHLILSGFHDIQWHEVNEKLAAAGMDIEHTCSGDRSFFGEPPSGSFTWMAIRARKRHVATKTGPISREST